RRVVRHREAEAIGAVVIRIGNVSDGAGRGIEAGELAVGRRRRDREGQRLVHFGVAVVAGQDDRQRGVLGARYGLRRRRRYVVGGTDANGHDGGGTRQRRAAGRGVVRHGEGEAIGAVVMGRRRISALAGRRVEVGDRTVLRGGKNGEGERLVHFGVAVVAG